MNVSICGVAIRNKFGGRFEELLWEWISIVERTTRRWSDDDDAAWMYNERASVSILGGAVWRMGGLAFEEFLTDKPNRPQPGNHNTRGDLFFEYNGHEYIAEAKQCAPFLNQVRLRGVINSLERAKVDALACNPYDYVPLAMVFAAPKLRMTQAAETELLIRLWVDSLVKLRVPAIAWTFPRAARNKEKNGYVRPGVAILITNKIGPA